MTGILTRWLVLTVALAAAAYLIEGIAINSVFSAVLAAGTLVLLNAFLKPILLLLTLPINVLSLGLFTFVVNAFVLKTASVIIPGFTVSGFWPAVFGSILISVVSGLLNRFIGRHLTDRGAPPDQGRPPGSPLSGKDNIIDMENKGDDHWE
jgi:putative membrane protein